MGWLVRAAAVGIGAGWAAGALAQAPVEKPDGVTRVAVLGCLRQFEPTPALYRYTTLDADLAIWVGDNVYADTRDDPGFIEACYRELEAKPEFRALRERVPFLVTWDDHDFGLNNAGKEYPLKAEARELFLDFWQLRDRVPHERQGVWYSEMVETNGHTLQVILLDVRSLRDRPGPDADMLGEAQWRWFERELRRPADLRFIVTGSQVFLDEESGSETWDEYPEAQARLRDTIRRAGVERTLFIAGDQHYAEVCRVDGWLDYDGIELQFAGVNQIEDPEFNPIRVTPPLRSKHSFCFIDILWEPTEHDVANLVYRAGDAISGQVEITYRVNFSEIELPLEIRGPEVFVDDAEIRLADRFPHLHPRFTTDGSEPRATSRSGESPLAISKTTRVRAALFDAEGVRRSPVREAVFERAEPRAASGRPEGLLPGLRYRYYEGAFKVLPDFSRLRPAAEGVADSFEPEARARRDDGYALVFEGWIEAPQSGMYTFESRSDDGSRIYLGDEMIVDNDGSHSARTRSGRTVLAAGWHPFRVEYFEDYDGQSLRVRWALDASELEVIPANRLGHVPGGR